MWRWVVRFVMTTCASLFVAGVFGQSGPLGFVGGIDLPDSTVVQTGVVPIRGFACAFRPLTRIEIYVDGVSQGNATMGFPRIDVVERYARQYPWLRDAAPGFAAELLAGRFSNGLHSMWLKAYTGDGRSVEFGRRTITVDNNIKESPLPLLNIPDPGGIGRITAFLIASAIFVWAIAAPLRHARRSHPVLVEPIAREAGNLL